SPGFDESQYFTFKLNVKYHASPISNAPAHFLFQLDLPDLSDLSPAYDPPTSRPADLHGHLVAPLPLPAAFLVPLCAFSWQNAKASTLPRSCGTLVANSCLPEL